MGWDELIAFDGNLLASRFSMCTRPKCSLVPRKNDKHHGGVYVFGGRAIRHGRHKVSGGQADDKVLERRQK